MNVERLNVVHHASFIPSLSQHRIIDKNLLTGQVDDGKDKAQDLVHVCVSVHVQDIDIICQQRCDANICLDMLLVDSLLIYPMARGDFYYLCW